MTNVHRREFLIGSTALGLSLASLSSSAFGQLDHFASESPATDVVVTPKAQRTIQKGLKYLGHRQNPDGSFGAGGYGRNVAVCALSGMTFLSSGSTPNRGPYGKHVSRCIHYILENAQESGFISAPESVSHGPMYGHGFATLFLAEAYGMLPDDRIREKLSHAVKLILDTQNRAGGWRYKPERRDADISVSVCQIMALRAARNAGINVPNGTIQQCVDYVKRSQNPDGGFMYQIQQGGQSAFARSAAALVALYSAGLYDDKELQKGLDYLMTYLPNGKEATSESHFFYGHYYAVQAMWHAGGKYWQKWYPAIRDTLVAQQNTNGSWPDDICDEYGTAMATIILQMPNNYLPIFQR